MNKLKLLILLQVYSNQTGTFFGPTSDFDSIVGFFSFFVFPYICCEINYNYNNVRHDKLCRVCLNPFTFGHCNCTIIVLVFCIANT